MTYTMDDLHIDWCCPECNSSSVDEEYIPAKRNPFQAAIIKFTCNKCSRVDEIDAAEYSNYHAHKGSGKWCYCNDTMHKHCDVCDVICNIDWSYEI
jgi:hypothetical protein